jgi:hypothetical protein
MTLVGIVVGAQSEWEYRRNSVGYDSFIYRLLIDLFFIVPAFLVHLWLPLIFVGGSINSGLRVFFKGVRFAQWFIERGDNHPYEAIAMTASVLVFFCAVLLQGARYLYR